MRESGAFLPQPEGYKAFIPENLPPKQGMEMDALYQLISTADRALARLDGIATILPNLDLFIAMYVRKEALLSSQIEGTQSTLIGVLEYEADIESDEDVQEVAEVVNYIKALKYGLERVKELPLSLRLIKEIHKILLEGARGSAKDPGEFRRTQNWIGPGGATINDAAFVPPPPHQVLPSMGELEKYMHSEDDLPALVKIGLIHAQFETIHPFLDGNGRIGRLLITFYLCYKCILSKPLLYLSFYLKKNRTEYYDRLMAVRLNNDWKGWLEFFLKGVIEVSEEATQTTKAILLLKEDGMNRLFEKKMGSVYATKLLEKLFSTPLVTVPGIQRKLNISRQTANGLVKKFVNVGILEEITGKKRYRCFLFRDYVDLMKKGTELE